MPTDGQEASGRATLWTATGVARAMFSRRNVGGAPEKCPKCGTEKIYFVQHSHGNYPVLDYVCPKCDLGGEEGIPEWYQTPEGKPKDADE